MVNECGISLYFRNNRIHIRKGTIEVLNHPAYVHLFINEGKKQMFIQSCEKNKDAFRVYYKARVERTEESFEENTVLHADNDEPGISCEKSKKDSLNNGKNSSTIEINPVMDKTENSNLSCNLASHIGTAAIYLGGVFAAHSTAANMTDATICVTCQLAPGDTAVCKWTTNDESTGGVDQLLEVGVQTVLTRRQNHHGFNDVPEV